MRKSGTSFFSIAWHTESTIAATDNQPPNDNLWSKHHESSFDHKLLSIPSNQWIPHRSPCHLCSHRNSTHLNNSRYQDFDPIKDQSIGTVGKINRHRILFKRKLRNYGNIEMSSKIILKSFRKHKCLHRPYISVRSIFQNSLNASHQRIHIKKQLISSNRMRLRWIPDFHLFEAVFSKWWFEYLTQFRDKKKDVKVSHPPYCRQMRLTVNMHWLISCMLLFQL